MKTEKISHQVASICERPVEPLLTVILNCFIALAAVSTPSQPPPCCLRKNKFDFFFFNVRHAKLQEKQINLEVMVLYTFINSSARFNKFCHFN